MPKDQVPSGIWAQQRSWALVFLPPTEYAAAFTEAALHEGGQGRRNRGLQLLLAPGTRGPAQGGRGADSVYWRSPDAKLFTCPGCPEKR